jgi:hypothetical protein
MRQRTGEPPAPPSSRDPGPWILVRDLERSTCYGVSVLIQDIDSIAGILIRIPL